MNVACLLLCLQVFAQSRNLTGLVTDASGVPQRGVSLQVKNTPLGTSTDGEGRYQLSVPSDARILVVSAVGYSTLELDIAGKTSLNIQLVSASQSMDEVVVVAYGAQKRESITGSVATIGAKQLESRLTTNITQALAGAAPGISATSGNGQPGSSAAIRIRGFGSINASSAPLYVVDGFPYDGYIGDLNTNDIETISLLKDASSTALYGARAANGVVMVTTKRGKTAEPRVNLNISSGFSQRAIPEYDRVGAYDYYPLMWQALKHSLMYPSTGTGIAEGAAATQASATIAGQLFYNPFNVASNQLVGTDGKLNPNAQLLYDDFDWFAPIEKNGRRSEAALSISGRQNRTDYFFSLNYLNDEGFVLKTDYERFSARVNLNTQVKSWLRTGLNLGGVLVNANNARAGDDNTSSIINPFVFARGIGPIYPVHAYSATGAPVLDEFGNHLFDYGMHPGAINRPSGAYAGRHIVLESMLNQVLSTRNSLMARTFLEGKFLKDFTFTANLGLDLNNIRGKSYQNKTVGDGVTAGGTSFASSNEYRTVSMDQLLNYNKKFGRHQLNMLLGHENQWRDELYFSGGRRKMNLDGNVELINFVELDDLTGRTEMLRRDGYFSRLNYNLDGKYFAEASFRRDASSRFSPVSRWGNFYSLSGAWLLKKEAFLSQVDWLDDLKIRAAFGAVGNDALDTYYEYQAFYALGWNNAAQGGAIASKIANDSLTWEINKSLSLGVDFGLFRNRLSGSLELFNRGSSGLLFEVQQGLSSVVPTRTENVGSMWNQGVELQLNGELIRSRNLNWNLLLNVTSLRNRITKLPGGQPIINGTKRLEEGKDIYNFWLRQWYGVDPTDGAALYLAEPGITANYRLSKTGDTVVTNHTLARFDYAGSAIPKVFGSIGSTLEVKGFSLSFLLNYQLGGKFYDGNYAALMRPSYGSSLHADVLQSWKQPGDETAIPRLDIANTGMLNAASSRWLVDASYLSFRNVTLAYALNRGLLDRLRLSQMKFYVSGENLAVLSKRKGMNPSESFNGTNSAIYTPNRVVSAGINLSF